MAAVDYLFRLFIAGDEPNSRLAEKNLRAICDEHLPARHRIEVIDVLQNFEAAVEARVMVAPAVVVSTPRPVTILGTLTDRRAVLSALAL